MSKISAKIMQLRETTKKILYFLLRNRLRGASRG